MSNKKEQKKNLVKGKSSNKKNHVQSANSHSVNLPMIIPEVTSSIFEEPFSHNLRASSKKLSKVINNKIFDKLLDSDITTDVKKEMDLCASTAKSSMSTANKVVNSSTGSAGEVLSKINSSVNKLFERNINFCQDFLKCNNAEDIVKFQQKVLDSNTKQLISLYVDITQIYQNLFLKNIAIATNSINKNIKMAL